MPALNKCSVCGFDLEPNHVADHMQRECIRLIAAELRAVKDAAAKTAGELDDLRRKLK